MERTFSSPFYPVSIYNLADIEPFFHIHSLLHSAYFFDNPIFNDDRPLNLVIPIVTHLHLDIP